MRCYWTSANSIRPIASSWSLRIDSITAGGTVRRLAFVILTWYRQTRWEHHNRSGRQPRCYDPGCGLRHSPEIPRHRVIPRNAGVIRNTPAHDVILSIVRYPCCRYEGALRPTAVEIGRRVDLGTAVLTESIEATDGRVDLETDRRAPATFGRRRGRHKNVPQVSHARGTDSKDAGCRVATGTATVGIAQCIGIYVDNADNRIIPTIGTTDRFDDGARSPSGG